MPAKWQRRLVRTAVGFAIFALLLSVALGWLFLDKRRDTENDSLAAAQ